MSFFKKKHDKKIAQTIFDYFKFEKTDKETVLLGDFADKDFRHWLVFVHGQIQAILKSKLIDGKNIENYYNITLYICGQRVDIDIIKDGGKSPHELLQELKATNKVQKEKIDIAIEQAINNFDRWNKATGYFAEHTTYYYECESVIEDAVKIGIMAALNIPIEFDEGGELIDKLVIKP